MKIQNMTMDHYNDIINMFEETPGVTLRDADSIESTERYLKRNPGLSFIAMTQDKITGCIMCGHDGRRGYLQHLVVLPDYRNQGVGEKLVSACIQALKETGIHKTHIFAFKTNGLGNKFWAGLGWKLRDEINMYSFNSSDNENI